MQPISNPKRFQPSSDKEDSIIKTKPKRNQNQKVLERESDEEEPILQKRTPSKKRAVVIDSDSDVYYSKNSTNKDNIDVSDIELIPSVKRKHKQIIYDSDVKPYNLRDSAKKRKPIRHDLDSDSDIESDKDIYAEMALSRGYSVPLFYCLYCGDDLPADSFSRKQLKLAEDGKDAYCLRHHNGNQLNLVDQIIQRNEAEKDAGKLGFKKFIEKLPVCHQFQENEVAIDEDIASIPDEEDTVLTFGIHEGKTYAEVMEEFPDYCQNVVNERRRGSKQQEYYDFVQWIMKQQDYDEE